MESQSEIKNQEIPSTGEPSAGVAAVDAVVGDEAPVQAVSLDSAAKAEPDMQPEVSAEPLEVPPEEAREASAGDNSETDLEPRIYDRPAAKVLQENESVHRAKFPQLEDTITTKALGKIEYLKDVDLDASVELGNTVLTVEKILNLNVGSIIELNQTIGDQVRLLINGNPYACGEVVVIGDKFGVRITKLLH
ncbi:FliM/FliN family flagellar motor switch protein [bacterium]|nr:FliM/FliN family flagellar motor switch protein [bacterium]